MELESLAIVMAAFLFAAFVKGTTGLGFSTAALPILVLSIGLKAALPLVIIPSLTSNVLLMRSAGQFRPTLRRFWPLYLASLPGIAFGLALLAWVDPLVPTAVLGTVLIAYSAYALSQRRLALRPSLERPLKIPTGLVTGLINGWTGSQVMPVLPYLMALGLEPNRFVQAINISFTVGSLAMIIGLSRLGLFTADTALVSALGVLPVFAGVHLGTRARRWLSPDGFRRAVLIVLICLGSGMIVRSLI